jgi:collagen type I/II/III/V/XI/XXIV/XXVII alpha
LTSTSSGATGVGGAFPIDSGQVFSGVGVVSGNVVDNGSVSTANFGNSPTVLSITGDVTGGGLLSAVRELDVGGAIGSGITVGLFGNDGANAGLLRLAQPMNDAGTLATFTTNSTLALTGLQYDTADWTAGSLTITGASGTLVVATSGDFSHQTYIAQTDPISGTDIVAVACFAAGTLLAAEDGPVAVEVLRVGDRLITADGACEPVVWVGRREVNCARHPKPETVWPVRVRAGAFGEHVPVRDLYLSPDHAVFVNGVLVPVRLLINGSGIAQVKRAAIAYFHVELSRREVILAEGLPVESYLATGERADFGAIGFIGPHSAVAARPNPAAIWETKGVAPLMLAGAGLAAARAANVPHAA